MKKNLWLLSLPLLVATSVAQVSHPLPSTQLEIPFDVTVVRPEADERDLSLQITKTGLSATGVTFDSLVRLAFDIDSGQIVGEPHWASTQRYSIQAKVAEEDTSKWQQVSPQQIRGSIRLLLFAKFNMAQHMEQKESSVLDLLTINGDSTKLNRALSKNTNLPPFPFETVPGRIDFNDASLDTLCTVLSNELKRKVLNGTGSSGTYRFKLRYTPYDDANIVDSKGDPLPSLQAVLKEELGLRLVGRKEVIPTLVIDQVKQPQAD